MAPDASPIFDAALALPVPLRADLAARLLKSLEEADGESGGSNGLLSEIESASDELHRGEAELVDGEEALEIIQAAIDRAAAKK